MAEMFANAGDAAGVTGKWHIGHANGRCPTGHGFCEWCGVPSPTNESDYPSLAKFSGSGVSKTPRFAKREREHTLEKCKAQLFELLEAIEPIQAPGRYIWAAALA